MSLPHECECRICGNKMQTINSFGAGINYNDPKITGTAIVDLSNIQFICPKHGIMNSPNRCTKCEEEKKI